MMPDIPLPIGLMVNEARVLLDAAEGFDRKAIPPLPEPPEGISAPKRPAKAATVLPPMPALGPPPIGTPELVAIDP